MPATGEPPPHEYRVLASETVFDGRVITLQQDTVAMPGGGDSVRDVVRHPGAAAVDYQESARLPVTFDEPEKVGI